MGNLLSRKQQQQPVVLVGSMTPHVRTPASSSREFHPAPPAAPRRTDNDDNDDLNLALTISELHTDDNDDLTLALALSELNTAPAVPRRTDADGDDEFTLALALSLSLTEAEAAVTALAGPTRVVIEPRATHSVDPFPSRSAAKYSERVARARQHNTLRQLAASTERIAATPVDECSICLEPIQCEDREAVWSCTGCHQRLHAACFASWANSQCAAGGRCGTRAVAPCPLCRREHPVNCVAKPCSVPLGTRQVNVRVV